MTDKTNESPFRPYISPTAYNTSDFSLDTPGLIEQTNQTIQDNPEIDFFEGTAFEQTDAAGEGEEQEGEQVVGETAEVIDPSTANVQSDVEKPIRAQLDYTIPINAVSYTHLTLPTKA